MRLRWKKGYLFGSLLIFDIYTNLEILPEMIISAMPDPIIIHCKGRISASGPNIAMPIGKKPEYMVPSSPKTRPCIDVSVFSCSIVVIAVCTIVNATP